MCILLVVFKCFLGKLWRFIKVIGVDGGYVMVLLELYDIED